MTETNSERKSATALNISLLPVALVLIVAATAIPIEFRNPSIDYFAWRFDGPDVFVNILLYIPIGLALRYKRLTYALTVFSIVTVTIEFMQLFYVNRSPSLWDILANILGGTVGWCLVDTYRRFFVWGPRSAAIRIALLGGSITGLIVLRIIISQPGMASDFSDWDPSYHLAIKDELTGERTWRGTLYALGLFDQSLSRAQLADFSPALLDRGLLANRSGRIKPIYTLVSPKISEQKPGRPILRSEQEKEIFNALVTSGAMTVLAWIQPDDLDQYDSARIVTLSKDHYNRNFTLGQEGGRLVFRLRTPASGPNGFDPSMLTPEILKIGQPLFVAATYDGRVSKVYLDGKLVGRLNLAAKRKFGTTLFDYDAPLAAILVGMLTAVSFITLLGSFASEPLMWLFASAAGFFGAVLLAASGGLSALPDFANWSLLLGACGGLSIALAVHNGNDAEQ